MNSNPMLPFLIPLILACCLPVARADSAPPSLEPLPVGDARLDHLFGEAPTDRQTRDTLRDLNLLTDVPGLLYAPTNKDHELESARRLGAALHAHYGYTLALISTIDRVDVPAFDGVVLDADLRVIANFSLKTKQSVRNVDFEFKVARGRAATFGRLNHWRHHLLQEARTLVGLKGRSKKGEEVVIKAPGRQNAYLRRESAARKMVAIFGVGTDRPTWILGDLSAAPSIEAAEVEELRAAMASEPTAPRAYLFQTHALTLVRPDAVEVHAPAPAVFCNDVLMAAE